MSDGWYDHPITLIIYGVIMSLKSVVLGDLKAKSKSNISGVNKLSSGINANDVSSRAVKDGLSELRTIANDINISPGGGGDYTSTLGDIQTILSGVETAVKEVYESGRPGINDIELFNSNDDLIHHNGDVWLRGGVSLFDIDDYPDAKRTFVADMDDPCAKLPRNFRLTVAAAKGNKVYIVEYVNADSANTLSCLDTDTGEFIYRRSALSPGAGTTADEVNSDTTTKRLFVRKDGTLELGTDTCILTIDESTMTCTKRDKGLFPLDAGVPLSHPLGFIVYNQYSPKGHEYTLYNDDFSAMVNWPGTSSPHSKKIFRGSMPVHVGDSYLDTDNRTWDYDGNIITGPFMTVRRWISSYDGGLWVNSKILGNIGTGDNIIVTRIGLGIRGRTYNDQLPFYVRIK